MKIGIIDVDTSHPRDWIPLLRELGGEIVGLNNASANDPSGVQHPTKPYPACLVGNFNSGSMVR